MILSNLVQEAEEILKAEFQVVPYNSNYVVHNTHSWNEFIQNTRASNSIVGIYLPRTLTAHLDGDSEYLSVSLLHEYFGHGLFCEHSSIGHEIINQERELEELEKLLLGVEELPENTIISVSDENPYFQEYVTKIDQTKKFMQNTWQIYEGFALWMEYFLASNLGQKGLIEAKLADRSVVSQQEVDLLERFLEFEKKEIRY